ncbi:glucan biosynthesis protein [Shigella flexneri]
MWRGNGEWICRPLNNPKLQFNAYTDNNPKGLVHCTGSRLLPLSGHYGLVQQTPKSWAEPRNKWGKGHHRPMEIPTMGQTLDNIVCFSAARKSCKGG